MYLWGETWGLTPRPGAPAPQPVLQHADEPDSGIRVVTDRAAMTEVGIALPCETPTAATLAWVWIWLAVLAVLAAAMFYAGMRL